VGGAKMKYRVIKDQGDLIIVTEDGGVAYYSKETLSTELFQGNLNDVSPESDLWDELSDGNVYIQDWEDGTDEQKIVQDALNWLVAPAPDNWQHDEALFSERFDD
jgi:hypothetical protein